MVRTGLYEDLPFIDKLFINYLPYILYVKFLLEFFLMMLIICFGCVIYLSYLRRVPPNVSAKKMLAAIGVLLTGAVAIAYIAYFKNTDVYDFELDIGGIIKGGNAQLSFEVLFILIIMITVCIGTFIITGGFDAKHIATIIEFQLLTFVLKMLLKYICISAEDFFGKTNTLFCENLPICFWYSCIVALTVIVFLLLLPERSSLSKIKNKYIIIILLSLIMYIVLNFIMSAKMDDIILSTDRHIIDFFLVSIYCNLLNALIPILFYILLKFVYKQSDYDYNESLVHENLKQSEAYFRNNEEFMHYIHDLPKHLKLIDYMASQANVQAISDYAKDLTSDFYKTRNKFMSGNFKLDEILKFKKRDAETANAEIVFSGVFPEKTNIKDNDLKTVFLNAIDNAIESCKKLDEPSKILINSKTVDEDMVIVKITNPCIPNPKKRKTFLKTTKTDYLFHGYGCRIIMKTVKDYGGATSWEENNGIFTLTLSMRYK